MNTRVTPGERIFNIVNVTVLVLLCVAFLLPVWTVFATSFVSEAERLKRGAFILWPQHWDITAYRMLLGKGSIVYQAYGVTLIRTVVGTLLNLLFTSTLAYGLS